MIERLSKGDAHRRVLQHVGDDEKADHAPADVDLVELGHAPIASGHGDLFQRDVQVVFGCGRERLNMLVHELSMGRTSRKFSAVELASFQLNGNDMSERLVEKFYGNTET